MSALTRIELPERGMSLAAPEGTQLVSEVPLVLWLPAIGGLRPWFALGLTPTDAPSAGEWVQDELARQLDALEIALLLSHEPCELWGLPGVRTLVHHAAGGRAMTIAQWWAIIDGIGVQASGSCLTPHYHLVAPVLDDIVEGARFDADE